MSNMKCPFCGGILEQSSIFNLSSYVCTNSTCKGCFMTATKDMWQEFIHTRKALDVAKKGLQEFKGVIACPPDISYETCVSMYADGVLQEITTAEQKD